MRAAGILRGMTPTQSILVTGASSGFGRLISGSLLDRGHTVFATMRDPQGRNAEAAGELRGRAETAPGTLHVLELDVTDDASVASAVGEALRTAGGLDVVVNNAGVGSGGFAETFTPAQYLALYDVNVVGVQRVNRAVLPSMRRAGQGLLLHISSIRGRIVLPYSGPYTATKWALEGLVETYKYELDGTGVDVAIIQPGVFPTGIGERLFTPADAARAATYGALQHEPDRMWGGIVQTMNGPDAPNPQLVADVVLAVIAMPAGQRPLRTVVDPLMGGEGPRTLNAASEAIQQQILANLP